MVPDLSDDQSSRTFPGSIHISYLPQKLGRSSITLSYVDLTMSRLPVVVDHEFSRHNPHLAEYCHHRLGDALGHGGSSSCWMVGSQALGQRGSAWQLLMELGEES